MWHQRHLVIGQGEVGRAIFSILIEDQAHTVSIRDLHDEPAMRPDVLHICFPYGPDFVRQVEIYQTLYQSAELTIIHSTVPVGTSRKLGAVHSPVMGRHPNLADDMHHYPKFFGNGSVDSEILAVAAAIFAGCGLRTVTCLNSETTEAGKLWQTLQYGYLIALQKEGYAFMRSHGADPAEAYDLFNIAYNDGMRSFGLQYRLPVIEEMPGPIGGHCVIPNLELTESMLARILQEFNAGWAEQAEQERPVSQGAVPFGS